ncbi:Ankyrin-3 [Ilyodon furcidens]|uniref:Ankyrin-3 n=1 Tax=Ilyodon furcidens TaxID=33524 RepID=A0ABV0U379_9TELE
MREKGKHYSRSGGFVDRRVIVHRSADLGEDAMTGDMDKYLRPQDLKELGDDSLPQEGYMGFSIGARSASPRIR